MPNIGFDTTESGTNHVFQKGVPRSYLFCRNIGLTKDEMRFIMSAMGHELTDEQLRELIAEIAGAGQQQITEKQFLNFCYEQLQADRNS